MAPSHPRSLFPLLQTKPRSSLTCLAEGLSGFSRPLTVGLPFPGHVPAYQYPSWTVEPRDGHDWLPERSDPSRKRQGGSVVSPGRKKALQNAECLFGFVSQPSTPFVSIPSRQLTASKKTGSSCQRGEVAETMPRQLEAVLIPGNASPASREPSSFARHKVQPVQASLGIARMSPRQRASATLAHLACPEGKCHASHVASK
ncbi:uncharacterized protein LOC121936387 [Sceloporus undulatus]|uniref:uncharacterized protein LOC121936387 n=1 Tax=Sceloporus undulatus TaxID=8520 RepID=UPI001C4D6150|nr:uncharacterized protein LOC121936387 [Sceloporus undulatus]